MYTSLSTVLFVLKRKFDESRDLNRKFSPKFQSNQLLSKIRDEVKRLILAYSLANSRGSGVEVEAPGLLEPFLPQIWISIEGSGR